MQVSEGFRKYLTNTSWLLMERVVRLVVVLFTGILVARSLGPELFGQLNYATGFVGLFFALATMGLDEIVVRDLVRRPGRRDELLGTAAVIKLAGSMLLVVLLLVATMLKDMDGLTASIIVVVGCAELLRPFGVIDWYFMAQVRSRDTVVVQMAQVFISAAAKIAIALAVLRGMLPARDALILFAWTYMLENAALAVGYALRYMRDGATLRAWRYSRRMAGFLLKQSWPLVIYGMALYVQARIDQVMIFDVLRGRVGAAAANEEVGQYSNALKMIEALGFLPVIVQRSLAPAITRAKARSAELYGDRLVNQYRLMFLLFLLTSVPLYFIAEPLMVFLYGEAFRPAGHLLSLFAIRLLFTNMGVAKASFITNESLFKYALLTAVVGAGLNVGMNYFLIPPFKAIGAIWSTIGSFAVSIFIMDLFFARTRVNLKWMLLGMASFWRIRHVR
ncbi:MAG: flippase [Flavobacteriales bacterium]|jgi:O-antigen/teichoic acid export membrane protein|nr:flippase [Flavobacteriales bacterium]